MARMLPNNSHSVLWVTLLGTAIVASGCAWGGWTSAPQAFHAPPRVQPGQNIPAGDFVSHQSTVRQADWNDASQPAPVVDLAPPTTSVRRVGFQGNDDLLELVAQAQVQNPRLRGLQQEVAAAQARVNHIDKLPDPTIGANIFVTPIETAAGSQTANLTVAQRFPWFHRLDAQVQQAFVEALVAEQNYNTQRLKVIGDVRALWFRLYVLGKQIETNQANQALLQSLIDIANARVAAGGASQGDVLLGTLELSRLAEQLLLLQQQVESTRAELNRVIGRPADHPIAIPQHLVVSLPSWSHASLQQSAIERQPDIAAARLRAEAREWGVEVARLQRRPDVSISGSWFAINDDRPTPNIVDVGRDAWSVGVQMSVPIWHNKYSAMEEEAAQRHLASRATVEDVINRYDALLRDLWEQARAAEATSQLYRTTILPQAEQTLQADQESYSTGGVEFDRVVGDLRNVLTLQLEHHRAVGRLAIALARIQQAAGTDLLTVAAEDLPVPAGIPIDRQNP
ncbi:MAG: TolC family protein [Planctomycetota bacterium]|nr:MAG: TolC family protein [Planctomycetota bacterium]REJ88958.1 MAG: TolC family protein [Planctomycetota bacterium]REK31206.1 MAG: TolC family protein [Planctomycetota bacterium]